MAEPTPNAPGNRLLPGPTPWLAACRLSILVALGASAALFIQYLDPAGAAFCGLDSGCEVVRRAGYRALAGVAESSSFVRTLLSLPFMSIPMVGLVGYGTLFLTSMASHDGKWTLRVAGVGAVVALILMFVQLFLIHALCYLCFVVDGAAVVAFVFASLSSREKGSAPRDPLRRWAWMALAALALAIPYGWPKVKPLAEVPAVIRALYVPGKINVVEFADFECPFCRMFHPVLQKVLAEHAAEVHFVRRHVPLPGHEEAGPAAAAAVCAELQGKGEEIARRLMVGELNPDALRQAARDAGVDLATWDRCMQSPEPGERILSDIKTIEAAGMLGLPTTYVQDVRLLGAVPEPALREAFQQAASGKKRFSMPGFVYATLALFLAATLAWLGKDARGNLGHERSG